jgi:hypothetical protein
LYTTSVVPSARWLVESSDGVTPLPATGGPLVVSGGQVLAQDPEQVDCVPVSASNKYRLLPSGPTRKVPRLALVVPMVTGF